MSRADSLDAITLEAIDWMVRLTSGMASDVEQHAFGQWLQADAAHRHAWEQVSDLLAQPVGTLQQAGRQHPLHGQAVQRILASEGLSVQRRRLLGGGLALLVCGLGGVVAVRQVPGLASLSADARTGSAERQAMRLEDGSLLELNAQSAADLLFDQRQRLLRLRRGELIVSVAPDRVRPFVVRSAQAEVQALEARFMLRQAGERSLLVVLESQVRLLAPSGAQRLEAGQAVWFDRHGIQPLAGDQSHRAAWRDGRLEVRDQPLEEVIESLGAYFPGYVRLSPQVAGLRVFGVFRLDQPRQALQSLAETLPIRVRHYGPLLTLIEAA